MGLATKTESWPGKKEKKKKKKTKQIALPCFFSLLFFPSPKPNKTVCQKLILIKWSHWQVDSSPTKKNWHLFFIDFAYSRVCLPQCFQ